MTRVIVYVDGFNLYYGLREAGWKRYYWLNIQALARNLLRSDQILSDTKYFTSRVSACRYDPDKGRRQGVYLEALSTLSSFQMYFGHYLHNRMTCRKCGACWETHEEKMTDVNIAVELMTDAFQDAFDTALLISGDSDLTAPVEAVHRLFPRKAVVVGFPPHRHSARLEQVARARFVIGRKKFADSQFPDEVRKLDGYTLRRPERWR